MKEIGVMGLGVMGKSIATNFANHGINVIGFNRSYNKTKKLVEAVPDIKGVKTIAELVNSLVHPRNILLMVPAGASVDDAILKLLPHLQKGDVIIDGGNSHFNDTHRREAECKLKGISFLGLGISGGEEGALKGPSMMLGGEHLHASKLLPLLQEVAAQTPEPCVAYLGLAGAGHFVKMIHNGIEYAEMQSIAEVYYLTKKLFHVSNEKMVEIFKRVNASDLSSYLLEITVDILQQKDDLGEGFLLDKISDAAKSKGTGRWTVEYALQQGVSASTITAALDVRIISSQYRLRRCLHERFKTATDSPSVQVSDIHEVVSELLFFSKMIIYSQSIELLMSAKKKMEYSYDLPTIFKVWRNGCIIRSAMLDQIASALEKGNSLLLDPEISLRLEKYALNARKIIAQSIESGISIPVLTAAIQYFEMCRANKLPTDLIQAQRDYFGAHTYERIDREGTFHTAWGK